MKRHSLMFIGLCLAWMTGCRNERIQTYRVPKEAAPAMETGTGAGMDVGGPAGSAREIEWETPAGWVEQPASAMRVGSFLINGGNGRRADMSVIPLSGEAGGDLANINRWRGQIQLGPIDEAELPRRSETIRPGGRRMLFIEYGNAAQNKRLMAAIYKRDGRTWFFKMMGDDPVVRTARRDFMKFLESVKFHE